MNKKHENELRGLVGAQKQEDNLKRGKLTSAGKKSDISGRSRILNSSRAQYYSPGILYTNAPKLA